MNQILETKLTNKKVKSLKIKKILKFQFLFSIIFIIVISISLFYNTLKLNSKEKYSNQLLNNYNIVKLYSNLISNNAMESSNDESIEDSELFNIIGILEISKINLYYPVFSDYSDELLKISPCRFYGSAPGKIGNLCIAGHNYDNNKFFSKISSLNNNDEIIIYNISNKKFSYFVVDIYEVKFDDLSPVYSYDNSSSQLTLVTCNNVNNNRIIVKALLKE